jgi:hypothetical protein
METFLQVGMKVEQSAGRIRLHLHKYFQDIATLYSEFTQKTVRPRKTPSQPGPALTKNNIPIAPDLVMQNFYQLIIAKLQFAATWILLHVSYPFAQLA